VSVLIIKLGATGDVVRTTPLRRRLNGPVSWVTAENNLSLLRGSGARVEDMGYASVTREDRQATKQTFVKRNDRFNLLQAAQEPGASS